MHSSKFLVVALVLGLVACGGGGGSGAPPSGGTPPPAGENPPEPPPESPPEPPPESPPGAQAAILFPWKHSGTTTPNLVVRGTASSDDGVAQVLVNGMPAVLVPRPAVATSEFTVTQSDTATDVDWSIEVPLSTGVNKLFATVVDGSGETTDEADSAQVHYYEVPVHFSLDATRSRVVGLGYALTSMGKWPRLIEHDYLTAQQKSRPWVFVNPSLICLRAQTNELLYLTRPGDGSWVLRRVDLDTESNTIALFMPSDAFDPVDEFHLPGDPRDLACDSSHDAAFLHVRHVTAETFQLGRTRILRIDLNTQAVTLLAESEDSESPPWTIQGMALAGDSIITVQDPFYDLPAPLTRIALADGARSALTPGLDVAGVAIAPDLARSRVFVAGVEGIEVVEVGSQPAKTALPPVAADSRFAFVQPRVVHFDAANNRLLVGDEALDAIIAVDATGGVRSDFLSLSIGKGPPIIVGRRLALSATAQKAFIADDGGNAAERVYEVDLANGDRRVVGDIDHPFNVFLTGLALDEPGGRVFVSSHDRILEVGLSSGLRRTVATAGGPDVLQSISDLLFDPANDRLIVADNAIDAIVTVDLANFQQSILSQAGVRGTGDGFQAINSLTFGDADRSTVYVTNQTSDKIARVGLDTGNRETIATGCAAGYPPDELGNDGTLLQVSYDIEANELLILGDRLFSYEMTTGTCTKIPLSERPLAIQVTGQGQILAVGFQTLVQIDRDTGEVVIVSK